MVDLAGSCTKLLKYENLSKADELLFLWNFGTRPETPATLELGRWISSLPAWEVLPSCYVVVGRWLKAVKLLLAKADSKAECCLFCSKPPFAAQCDLVLSIRCHFPLSPFQWELCFHHPPNFRSTRWSDCWVLSMNQSFLAWSGSTVWSSASPRLLYHCQDVLLLNWAILWRNFYVQPLFFTSARSLLFQA